MSTRAERSFSRGKFQSGQWKTRKVSIRPGLLRSFADFISLKRKGVDHLASKCFSFHKVMDFGCGTGAYSRWFIDRCQCTILAVDWSIEALKSARLNDNSGKVLPVCADLHLLPFKHESIDALFSVDALGHLSNQERALDEISRICRPGAQLFLHSECGDYRKRWPDNILLKKSGIDYLARLDGHYSIRQSSELNALLCRRFEVNRSCSPAGIFGWILGYPEKYRLAFKHARFYLLFLLTSFFALIKKLPLAGLIFRLLNAITNKVEIICGIEGGGSFFAHARKPYNEVSFSHSDHLPVDVIIPTYKRSDSVSKTVELIHKQCRPGDFLYVVWQGDEPPAVPVSNQVRLLYSSTPNLPLARNTGLKAGFNPVVIFLDDDIIPDANLIDMHRRCYLDKSIGAAAGFTDDPVFEGKSETPPWFDITNGEIYQNFSLSKSQYVVSLMGANMSFRRDVLADIGGFDENFKHNALFEEVDCAFRVMKAGYKIWYCAEARLTHLHNNSGGCRSDKRYRYLFHSFANTAYFLCKYSPRKSARSSTNFWKYRLEYLSRKPLKINSSKMRHDPFAVIAGLCGAGAGLARFFLYGKRIGLPSQILEEQESCK